MNNSIFICKGINELRARDNKMFRKPVIDVIRARSSWRTYSNTPLENATKTSLMEFIEDNNTGLFGSKIRFELLDAHGNGKNLGTYGFITGAPHFIVGAIKDSPMNMEEFGYVLEKIILYATDMGLGTCWLGGTFTRGSFAETINLQEDEIIPAITPIGYTPSERRSIGKIMRWAAKAKKRKLWDELFYSTDFQTPIHQNDAGEYSTALEMVRLGPSASNKQPWRILLDGNRIHFFCQGHDISVYQRLDMGIAMCHFDLTMKEQGSEGHWIKFKQDLEFKVEEKSYIVSWEKK